MGDYGFGHHGEFDRYPHAHHHQQQSTDWTTPENQKLLKILDTVDWTNREGAAKYGGYFPDYADWCRQQGKQVPNPGDKLT